MADVFSKKKRSEIMSRIKGKNTKPELIVRSFLFSTGYRYRLHAKNLPGKPDIVLKKYKTIIFVNGCFWHGHTNCKYAQIPKTRTNYWTTKISNNKRKDIKAAKSLRKLGWNIITIWECQLKPKKSSNTLRALEKSLRQQN